MEEGLSIVLRTGRIAVKRLTDADLGQSISNQTHIGLTETLFDYLPIHAQVENALFCYQGKASQCKMLFDMIASKNGKLRSPKIRLGEADEDTITKRIRETVKLYNKKDAHWYLLWFVTESEQPFFFLFNEHDEIYELFQRFYLSNAIQTHCIITDNDSHFREIFLFLKNSLLAPAFPVNLKANQIPTLDTSYKESGNFDLANLLRIQAEIGRKGESLVNCYLRSLKEKGNILDFSWENINGESGNPFDFVIIEKDGSVTYLDVKSTTQGWNQDMFLSKQELQFASANNSHYKVYRVFELKDNSAKLIISSSSLKNIIPLSKFITQNDNEIKQFNASLNDVSIGLTFDKSELNPDTAITITR